MADQKLMHQPYNKLKALMLQHNDTYADLGQALGRTAGTITWKINGKSDFSLSEAGLIMNRYGVGYDIFLP